MRSRICLFSFNFLTTKLIKVSVLSPDSKILDELCENIMKEHLMECFLLFNHTKTLTKKHFRLKFSTKV